MIKLFLDSANPLESQAADRLLKEKGFPGVEGQTTNPSLLKKYVESSGHLTRKQLTHEDVLSIYQDTVKTIGATVKGPVSVQVILQDQTTVESLLSQARQYKTWIPNAVVKFPCTKTGLTAAEIFCKEGPVNITLVFSQQQAAAVYSATKNRGVDQNGKPFDVFVSPFVGRLDDKGINGMDLVSNILAMYKLVPDNHVTVLAASLRNIKQLMYSQKLNCPAATLPLSVIDEWCEAGCPMPDDSFLYDIKDASELFYSEINLENPWDTYDIAHDLTSSGVSKFYADWEAIIASH